MTIKGILLDLSGTLHEGPDPIPGAPEAVARLLASGMPVRFLTNTSRQSRRLLHADLTTMGFDIPLEHLFTAPLALKNYLVANDLRPHLLINPALDEEFTDLLQDDPNAVVVGFAPPRFDYDHLNAAFRLLRAGAPLLVTGKNRFYQDEGHLSLDAGPFVVGLEYAADVEARVFGKPAADFFLQAVADLGCQPHEVVMVGDDARSDVGGAIAAGLQGMLVKSGKYREGDEGLIESGELVVVVDLGGVVEMVASGQKC